MTRHLAAVLAAFLMSGTPLWAAGFPQFSVAANGSGADRVAELLHGGTVLVRWRAQNGQDPAQVLAPVAERLNWGAFAGLSPTDFTSRLASSTGKGQGGDAVILLQGTPLLRVDAKQAALARSEANGLAALWARRLGAVFDKPYVLIRQTSVDVPLAERRDVELGGRLGDGIQVSSAGPGVAQGTVAGRRLIVTGMGVGNTTLTVRAGDWDASVRANVRKWAAQVALPVGLQVTGDVSLISWLPRMVRLAALAAMRPEPGARLALREAASGAPRTVVVSASGPDYFPMERTITVQLHPRAWTATPPALAILSNDPERVMTAQPLMRYLMVAGQPIHLMWHHVNGGVERLSVVLRLANSSDSLATVHVVGAEGGPSGDEVYVGHIAMQRFFSAWRTASGVALELPGRSVCELSRVPMSGGQVVSGMAAVSLVQGSGVFAEVASVSSDTPVEELSPAPANLTPTSATHYLELPGHKPMPLEHEVGRGWAFARIGRTAEDVSLHPRLRGEYGVLQDVQVRFRNPQHLRARLEIALRSGGGPARAVVDVNGTLIETGMLREGDEQVLFKERFDGEDKSVRVRLIPQGGSNYPMTVTARSFAD